MKFWDRIGKVFTSPYLICGLLVYSVFFVFFATLKIKEFGIASVQSNFFEAWFCKFWDFPIYVFGGKFLGLVAILSLAFSLVKFTKFSLRGIAFAIVHLGLICLIFSGFLQGVLRKEGAIALKQNEPTSAFFVKNSRGELSDMATLPFSIELVKFERKDWENTDLPSAFSSRVKFVSDGESAEKVLSMNEPASFGGFTFYQMSYQDEGRVSILQVVKNPFGFLPALSILITFFGVVLVYVQRLLRRGK